MHQEYFIEIIDKQLTFSNTRLPVFNATALRIQQEVAKAEPDIRFCRSAARRRDVGRLFIPTHKAAAGKAERQVVLPPAAEAPNPEA